MSNQSTRSQFSTLSQICKYIPGHLVAKLARTHGVDEQARTFTPWSHVVALLYAQLAHAIGLNNVSDGLRMHKGKLGAIRGATPPARILWRPYPPTRRPNSSRPRSMTSRICPACQEQKPIWSSMSSGTENARQ